MSPENTHPLNNKRFERFFEYRLSDLHTSLNAYYLADGDMEVLLRNGNPEDIVRRLTRWGLKEWQDYTVQTTDNGVCYAIRTSDSEVLERIIDNEAQFRHDNIAHAHGQMIRTYGGKAPVASFGVLRNEVKIDMGLSPGKDIWERIADETRVDIIIDKERLARTFRKYLGWRCSVKTEENYIRLSGHLDKMERKLKEMGLSEQDYGVIGSECLVPANHDIVKKISAYVYSQRKGR